MNLEIRELNEKDYKKAIQFAIRGMHLNWYMDNELILYLYGKYFWYMEMLHATQIISVYAGNELAGVLLAKIRGERQKYYSLTKSFYVKVFEILQNLFVKNGVSVYDIANAEMLKLYCKENSPDGELIFLAANPDIKIKGIGSTLLHEFEKRLKGKKIYLYTDSGCTYQFYEHRGFERVGEKDIIMNLGNKTVELQCLLYSKVL